MEVVEKKIEIDIVNPGKEKWVLAEKVSSSFIRRRMDRSKGSKSFTALVSEARSILNFQNTWVRKAL